NVGDIVACESALRSAGTLLSRVRAPPSAPRPDGGPKSMRLPCCGLAVYKTQSNPLQLDFVRSNRSWACYTERQWQKATDTSPASHSISLYPLELRARVAVTVSLISSDRSPFSLGHRHDPGTLQIARVSGEG
ncbi:hypothetical protein PoB_001435000, partial [Plakobranchus ocellatus]